MACDRPAERQIHAPGALFRFIGCTLVPALGSHGRAGPEQRVFLIRWVHARETPAEVLRLWRRLHGLPSGPRAGALHDGRLGAQHDFQLAAAGHHRVAYWDATPPKAATEGFRLRLLQYVAIAWRISSTS